MKSLPGVLLAALLLLVGRPAGAARTLWVSFDAVPPNVIASGNPGSYYDLNCTFMNPGTLAQTLTIQPFELGAYGYNQASTTAVPMTPIAFTLNSKDTYQTHWANTTGVSDYATKLPKAFQVTVAEDRGAALAACHFHWVGGSVPVWGLVPVNGGRAF